MKNKFTHFFVMIILLFVSFSLQVIPTFIHVPIVYFFDKSYYCIKNNIKSYNDISENYNYCDANKQKENLILINDFFAKNKSKKHNNRIYQQYIYYNNLNLFMRTFLLQKFLEESLSSQVFMKNVQEILGKGVEGVEIINPNEIAKKFPKEVSDKIFNILKEKILCVIIFTPIKLSPAIKQDKLIFILEK